MDDNLAIILLLAASIVGAVVLVLGTRSIKAAQQTALQSENEQLHAQVRNLTQRLATLEEIATDPAVRLEREIGQLR